jgi:hypothetical protein
MIYHLISDTANHSSFIQDYDSPKEEGIMRRVVRQHWRPFTNYQPIRLELRASDSGKKNYSFDISSSLFPFYIFSEKTLSVFGDIIADRGQILPVITESKRKKFFGYYPTRTFSGCLDMERSKYRKYEKGLVVENPVLIYKNLPDDELFTVEEDSRVFVTSDFKKIVEDNGLLGFDFSEVIETS